MLFGIPATLAVSFSMSESACLQGEGQFLDIRNIGLSDMLSQHLLDVNDSPEILLAAFCWFKIGEKHCFR